MSSYDRNRPMTPCRWRGCDIRLALMGDYCVKHHYWAKGQECPNFERKTPRPAIDRNTAVTGKRDTSRMAAAKVLPTTGTKRRTVYDAIMSNMSNGMTCDEVCEKTGMLVQSATSAINTLAQDGWLTDSGERRPTRTGVLATVWVAL